MSTRLLALAGVTGLFAAAYFGGLFEYMGDLERLRALVEDSGFWGPLLFVGLFSVAEAFGVPGVLFIVTASLLWPIWMAVGLCLAGSVGAGWVGFSFARYIAREWVQRKLPERFHRFDRRLAERGFTTVILVRLVFFLAPPSHWVLGLSRVRLMPFLLGTVIGLIPGITLVVFLGEGVFRWLQTQSRGGWIALGVAIVAIVLARVIAARRRSALRDRADSTDWSLRRDPSYREPRRSPEPPA